MSLYDTLRLLAASRAMQLLVPIVFYNGASLGFMGATFPLVYQDTSATELKFLPKDYVGYQAATFYVVNSLFSYVWGMVIPRVGRRPLFWITLVTHIVFYGCVLAISSGAVALGHETPRAFAAVFILAAIFAVGDSILESQIPAIIQSPTFFPEERDREAAISNLRMWQSLGYTIQFILGVAWPSEVLVQAWFVFPLMLLSLFALWWCDKFVRPVDSKGYANVGNGSGAGEGSAPGGAENSTYQGTPPASDGEEVVERVI